MFISRRGKLEIRLPSQALAMVAFIAMEVEVQRTIVETLTNLTFIVVAVELEPLAISWWRRVTKRENPIRDE